MSDEQTRPEPAVVPPPKPRDALAEAVAHTRETALLTYELVQRGIALLEDLQTTPEWRTEVLTAAKPIALGRHREPYRSVAIINPNPVVIYFGFAGASATPTSRVPSVPANGWATFPTSQWDGEIGADPAALGASSAVVYVGFYRAVQALAMGKLA